MLPGLIHQKLVSCACEILNVSTSFAVETIPDRFAHSQEVWPQTADGVLGYVGQRLASTSAKHTAPHSFVDTRHILGSQRLVLDARHVNRKALANNELQQKTLHNSPSVLWLTFKYKKTKKTVGHLSSLIFNSLFTTISVKGIMTPPSSWQGIVSSLSGYLMDSSLQKKPRLKGLC